MDSNKAIDSKVQTDLGLYHKTPKSMIFTFVNKYDSILLHLNFFDRFREQKIKQEFKDKIKNVSYLT